MFYFPLLKGDNGRFYTLKQLLGLGEYGYVVLWVFCFFFFFSQLFLFSVGILVESFSSVFLFCVNFGPCFHMCVGLLLFWFF